MNEQMLKNLRACIELGEQEVLMTAVGRFDFAVAQFIRQHGPALEQSLRSLADENQELLRERDEMVSALVNLDEAYCDAHPDMTKEARDFGRKALITAPVFDMERSQPAAVPEAAVEAAMIAFYGNHIVELHPDTSGMRLALTAALPFLGASAACDDIQRSVSDDGAACCDTPDMKALRRDAMRLDSGMIQFKERIDGTEQSVLYTGCDLRQAVDAAIAQRDTSEGGG